MNCIFVQVEEGTVRCTMCNRTVRTKNKPENCHAICRGEEFEKVKTARLEAMKDRKPCNCGSNRNHA